MKKAIFPLLLTFAVLLSGCDTLGVRGGIETTVINQPEDDLNVPISILRPKVDKMEVVQPSIPPHESRIVELKKSWFREREEVTLTARWESGDCIGSETKTFRLDEDVDYYDWEVEPECD